MNLTNNIDAAVDMATQPRTTDPKILQARLDYFAAAYEIARAVEAILGQALVVVAPPGVAEGLRNKLEPAVNEAFATIDARYHETTGEKVPR
jgi:hypothetical protein